MTEPPVSSITGWGQRIGLPRWIAVPLVAALFLASASFLLERFTPVLDWLDVAMLYVAPGIPTREPSPDPAAEILVVTIGARLFETTFRGQTPIPRTPLKQLLAEVAHRFEPALLAVDYDLSPGPDELSVPDRTLLMTAAAGAWPRCTPPPGDDERGRRPLDCYLASRGARLALIRMLPVEDESLCALRQAWERRMREAGVVFGDAELVHHALVNAMVKYEPARSSLASRAFCAALAPSDDRRCRRSDPPEPTRVGCRRGDPPVKRGELALLNFPGAVKGVRTCHLDAPQSLERCFEYYGRRGFRVVFVGAHSDQSDVFDSPVGPKPGVTLHAYAAYSMKAPLEPRHGWAFLLDVIVGALVGAFLHWSWGHYTSYGIAERLVRAGASLGAVSLVAVVLVSLAPWPMSYGFWINPGPMLLGLLVKSWHTSVEATHPPPSRRRDRVVATLYAVGWIAVVGAAMALIGRELVVGSH